MPHEPTDKTKAEVSSLASFGVTQQEISDYIGIDIKTLHKYYRKELDTASIKANAAVARVLYEKAVIDRDTTSVLFWLKTRAKWRETDKKEEPVFSVQSRSKRGSQRSALTAHL
jgi:hypothetical protein